MIVLGQKIHVSKKDTWSLNSTLAPIIKASLEKFLKVVQDPECVAGVPRSLIEDPEEECDGCADEAFKKSLKKWHDIIREMIFAFTYVTREQDLNPFEEQYYKSFKSIFNSVKDERGYTTTSFDKELLVPENEYKDIKVKYDMVEVIQYARYKRGLGYFSKHFESLWW